MKKIIGLVSMLIFFFCFAACSNSAGQNENNETQNPANSGTEYVNDKDNSNTETPSTENPNEEDFDIENSSTETPSTENPNEEDFDIENSSTETSDTENPDTEDSNIEDSDTESTTTENPESDSSDAEPSGTDDTSTENGDDNTNPTAKTLVVYFSCTGTTKKIAEFVADCTSGTLFEIEAKNPYTADDLKYYTDCRADREQNDATARPEIANIVDGFTDCDTIYIGYPIWHGQAPKIIYTFLESYDFSEKTIIPFCTSASSGIGSSDTNLHPLAPKADWESGKRFSSSTTKEDIEDWIVSNENKQESNMKIEIEITNESNVKTKLTATLADNSSATAFAEKLQSDAITIDMHDYGKFEKVGDLPWSLPRNDTQISTDAGDIILYLGNSITFYYDKNSWNFTRLGKLDAISDGSMSKAELKKVLGDGNITAVISLEK